MYTGEIIKILKRLCDFAPFLSGPKSQTARGINNGSKTLNANATVAFLLSINISNNLIESMPLSNLHITDPINSSTDIRLDTRKSAQSH